MFKISDLVAALKKQRQEAELQTLNARDTMDGLEVSGTTEENRTFRFVVRREGLPADVPKAPSLRTRPVPKKKLDVADLVKDD